MKKQFVFVILLIAMVTLTLVPVSVVHATDVRLPLISGSDCDPTTFVYSGHTIAEGFAVSISADLPIDGPITQLKFGGAVAGLGDTWDSTDGMNYYFKYTPFVNEIRLRVEGDSHYTKTEIAIYDNTGTGGSSCGLFEAVLEGIGAIFTAYDIYNWLADIRQQPSVAEWKENGHWSKAIVRQQKEFTGTQWFVNPSKPRLQTASANVWGYFEEDSSYILNVTAEADIYIQVWEMWSGALGQYPIGTYSVSFKVNLDLGFRTLTISASSGGTTNPVPGTYAYGYGEPVTVTASAYVYHKFDGWILDGSIIVYDKSINVTMDSDHTLDAYFSVSDGGDSG